jgi:restriction endonuclease S subunit
MQNYLIKSRNPSVVFVNQELIDRRFDAHYFSANFIDEYAALYNTGLQVLTLDVICKRVNSGPFGSALLSSQYVSEGVPLIRPLNCKNFIVENNEFVYITQEDSIRLKTSSFPAKSLLFTQRGNGVGDVAILPNHINRCTISANLIGAEVKGSHDPYYIVTFLKSKYGQNQLLQNSSNSVKPKIDIDSIKNIQVVIPRKEIQNYIGNKVRKAEELRKEAKRLKEEAEFIIADQLKFEFFFQRLNDITSKGDLIRQNNIIDRLDSKYYLRKYLTIDEHMKQFKLMPLHKFIKSINNGIEIRNFVNDGRPYLRITDLDDYLIDLDKVQYIPKNIEIPERGKVRIGDLIVSRSGTIGISKVISKFDKEVVISSHIMKLKINDNQISPHYLATFFNSKIGKMLIDRISYGGVQKEIGQDELKKLSIPIVDVEIQQKISDKILNFEEKIYLSKKLIKEAKQDVEDLIEGKFDESKISEEVHV